MKTRKQHTSHQGRLFEVFLSVEPFQKRYWIGIESDTCRYWYLNSQYRHGRNSTNLDEDLTYLNLTRGCLWPSFHGDELETLSIKSNSGLRRDESLTAFILKAFYNEEKVHNRVNVFAVMQCTLTWCFVKDIQIRCIASNLERTKSSICI